MPPRRGRKIREGLILDDRASAPNWRLPEVVRELNNHQYEERDPSTFEAPDARDSCRRPTAARSGRARKLGHRALLDVYLCFQPGNPALGGGKEQSLYLFEVWESDADSAREEDCCPRGHGGSDCYRFRNGGDFAFAVQRPQKRG